MDCVVGELLGHSFHDESIPVATSRRRHPPGPDFEALLRLLDAMETAYGAGIRRLGTRQLGEQFNQYYNQLAEWMAQAENEDRPGADYPIDRKFL